MGLVRLAFFALSLFAPPAAILADSSSALTVTATGLNNVLAILPQVSAATDYTGALNAILSVGKRAYLPYTGTPYQISASFTFAAGSVLVCDPGVVIKSTAKTGRFFSSPNSGAQIFGCTFDGQSAPNFALGRIDGDRFVWSGGAAKNTGQLTITGADNTIQGVQFLNGTTTALKLQGSLRANILENEFQNNAGFGIWGDNGAADGLLRGNWTVGNGLELIGLTSHTSAIRIIANRASGTGDNCFSISGNDHLVVGNRGVGCAYNPLGLYGNRNTVTGNVFKNGGQVHNPNFPYYSSMNDVPYAGIYLVSNFGGAAQNNIIVGNEVDDDQPLKTQAYGILLASAYKSWTPNLSVAASSFIYSAGNIYRAAAVGTTGSIAPTHTIGSVSDGGVAWTFIAATDVMSREPANNVIGPNRVYRAGTSQYADHTTSHANMLITEFGLTLNESAGTGPSTFTGGLQRKLPDWSPGVAVKFGDALHVASGNRSYRMAGGCATSTAAPSHSLGTVTGKDGCTWLYLGSSAYYPQVALNPLDSRANAPLYIGATDSVTAACPEYAGAGSPEGKVRAPVCGTYRRTDGGAGTTFYVKESGTGTVGWITK